MTGGRDLAVALSEPLHRVAASLRLALVLPLVALMVGRSQSFLLLRGSHGSLSFYLFTKGAGCVEGLPS